MERTLNNLTEELNERRWCKNLKQYEEYNQHALEIWVKRFTWKGLDFSKPAPKYITAMNRFFHETQILNNIQIAECVDDFFKQSKMLSEKYVEWVKEKSKNDNYTIEEFEDMKRFFIGNIGEFFFVELFKNVKSLNVPDYLNKGCVKRYNFELVCPLNETDFGVDLIGIANNRPSVFQVKWWNKYANESLKLEVAQKADSVGLRGGYIDINDVENIFICCLGDEIHGRRFINNYKLYDNKVVVIGDKSLHNAVDMNNTFFWIQLYSDLVDVSNKACSH